MTAYVRRLQEAVEQEYEEAAVVRAQEIDDARERLSPLKDRVARLLATIPKEVQREGLSLPELQVALRGRHRASCHPGELGTALRALGFARRRSWDNTRGFAARWVLEENG